MQMDVGESDSAQEDKADLEPTATEKEGIALATSKAKDLHELYCALSADNPTLENYGSG